MNKLVTGWNFMRVFRLLLGIFILIEGIRSQENAVLLFGGLFTLMPLFNIGCCGPAGCSTPISKDSNLNKEIEYEEIK
ncbi:MAG: hypothetical protein H3C31_12315 [Brumimicrobium sp.]|nr:hypothetical protein [Brumimicrobium sp.]MCO5269236.1 hypothetical protein [Brumimicrobium sp.]